MRFCMFISLFSFLTAAIVAAEMGFASAAGRVTTNAPARDPAPLHPNSLCARTEQIIFSCLTKRSGSSSPTTPAKIVSLCASRDLDKERGYLQYRYGLPGKVELEFP